MLLEQRIEKFLPPTEVRSPEPRQRVSEVDHAAACSEVENAQSPGDFEPPVARNCRASALINEDEAGPERQPNRIAGFSPSSNAANDGSSPALTTDTSSQPCLKFIQLRITSGADGCFSSSQTTEGMSISNNRGRSSIWSICNR
jgi:hypothetical protein